MVIIPNAQQGLHVVTLTPHPLQVPHAYQRPEVYWALSDSTRELAADTAVSVDSVPVIAWEVDSSEAGRIYTPVGADGRPHRCDGSRVFVMDSNTKLLHYHGHLEISLAEAKRLALESALADEAALRIEIDAQVNASKRKAKP